MTPRSDKGKEIPKNDPTRWQKLHYRASLWIQLHQLIVAAIIATIPPGVLTIIVLGQQGDIRTIQKTTNVQRYDSLKDNCNLRAVVRGDAIKLETFDALTQAQKDSVDAQICAKRLKAVKELVDKQNKKGKDE